MRREIRALQRELDFTAIYVTHDQAEALAMSDRVVVMRQGEIDQVGTPEEVYAKPETAFVADFVGAANILSFEPGGNGTVNTPIGSLAATETPPDEATHLCWRPEDATLAGVADATDDESRNLVRGVVVARAFQGAYTELFIKAGDGPDQRLHVPPSAPAVGEEVAFHLPRENIRFVLGKPQ